VSTGDLARVLPSGEVKVLGREGDSWARVLGYPVDLRRIERLLESHPAVKAAAVVPVAWRGRDRLVAWAVAPQESAEELSAFLAGTCPAFYLVPDLLICTSGLPLAGDAVDRDRLAALGRERLESERAARSGPVAPELRRIWEEILGCPAGDEESFFDLGGTSLRLARLLDGVDELYGGGPPLSC
jgi:acyl-CoA synthetase (AMP-forming)/AMP-acid ligase II